MLTDSEDAVDAMQCYELGASLFYTKSQWLEILVEIIKSSGEYWLDFAAKVSRERMRADEGQESRAKLMSLSSSYSIPHSSFGGYQADSHRRAP